MREGGGREKGTWAREGVTEVAFCVWGLERVRVCVGGVCKTR